MKEAVAIWKELTVATHKQVQFLDLTAKIESEVASSGVFEGICYLFVPHTTAGVTINENADPDVVRDLTVTLEKLVPRHGDYRHGEGNSDAHLKASLMGFSCIVPVSRGRLDLGTWQGIYFCEFDGPRHRKLKVSIIE
jgi:secondary thiamine-phosphate synthase enzyme